MAVGASAGHVRSLVALVTKLAPRPDEAVVVVFQHREALEEEHLRQALSGYEGTVCSIENGAPVEGGRLYLSAPNFIVTLDGGRFATRKAEQRPGSRGTIDSFLVSLAEDRREAALGIVLHGTAGDGTLGVAAIKEHGGLTIAEPGPGETPADLATSNVPGALADFVLPVGEIPDRVRGYWSHLSRLRERKGFDQLIDEVSGSLGQIATVLRNRTGHDFHGYKPQTFLRRVQRRMQVVEVDEVDAYAALLRTKPDEVQNLFNDLLIGVTKFFRDEKEFQVLASSVVPDILDGKNASDPVRVWVLGCATGEEAYSIAILLKEEMARRDIAPHVQIFATDIDGRALATARVGRYPATLIDDVSPQRLARWFVKEGDTYCVVKELRELCIFSAHNLIRDAPFSKLDLVSCRNLLIYLNAELQSRVIPLFHFALLPNRFLFLGNSENVTRHPKLFAPIDRRARIFRKLETGTRHVPEFPITAPGRRVSEPPLVAAPRAAWDGGLARRAERIVERYAPAYIVTDESFQVLHFSGRTGRFLEPTSGAASLDLLNLIHRDLRLDVRAALTKAGETNEPVSVNGLPLKADGAPATVDVVVEPIRDEARNARSFVLVLKDGVASPGASGETGSIEHARDEHVSRLEGELRVSRERLQATIEELESTNEELKSSNEEYQSLNEELQSANEELETSREELQSVNEELTTVNSELAHRVHELTRASSDLKNFLEATQIATLFLDNDMKVMNFTPVAKDIFHLVETDIGRPIAHIKSRIPFDELHEDIGRVLRTLTSVERSIENPTSHTRYIVRILPYRSVDNFIAGVVVTFVDVTALARAEERQKLLLAELQHRVRNTLAVVRSIVRRTAANADTVEDYAAHLEGRLDAFARVQSAVTRNPSGGVDLEHLVAEELIAHGAHEGERVSEMRGPKVILRAKPAEMLGLAVHELATNAVKYGALSFDTGRLKVDWTLEDGAEFPRLRFNWLETGLELADGLPERRGFGMELLERTLSYELGAETSLHFAGTGARCTIVVPLTDRVALSDALPGE